LICSFNLIFFLAVCLNISTVINIKILTNSNQQTQSYKFTSHIAAFLSVVCFDHWDAWNLHTNIIWSKRSTDFKELSPCSVWQHLNPTTFYCSACPKPGKWAVLYLCVRSINFDPFYCFFYWILELFRRPSPAQTS
jgi:hypothetical protein